MPFNVSAADTYRTRTLDILEPTRSEPGCLHFDVYEDVDALSELPRIWQYLVFEDEAAHQAHMASEVVATWIDATAGLIESSELTPLGMATPRERPVKCLKQAATEPLLTVVQMYVEDAAQQEKLRKGMSTFVESIRAEEGILYYDQLVPRNTSTPYVQEVVWYVDAAAQQKHMASAKVRNFMALFHPVPSFKLTMTKPVIYGTLPPCGMAVDV